MRVTGLLTTRPPRLRPHAGRDQNCGGRINRPSVGAQRRCALAACANAKHHPVTPFYQERLARDTASTDAEIDRLVYDLYDLTPEEIKIVEGE